MLSHKAIPKKEKQMSNQTICQKIASWFEPQTAPQPRFSVPKPIETIFEWHPVLEKAKLQVAQEEQERLSNFNQKLESDVINFTIEISSYRNKTIKIVRKAQIDVVPIDEIRKVSFTKGEAPKYIGQRYAVNKEGKIDRCSINDEYFLYSKKDYSFFSDEKAIPYKPDVIKISPILEISCPFGQGESIINKIQELMAE